MKTLKMITLFALTVLFTPFVTSAQEPIPILEFENAAANAQLVKNYTAALVKGDVTTMAAQFAEDAEIYGLSGAPLNKMNRTQLSEYFKGNFAEATYVIDENTAYLPLKVTDGNNKGEWVMVWTTVTVTIKESGKEIAIPAQLTCFIEKGKITRIMHYYDQLNVAQSQGYTLQPPSGE